MDDFTLDYYEKNADIFAKNTRNTQLNDIYKHFLKYVKKEGILLDFGCGSGRDTKYFCECGYRVDAVDGSEEMCKMAELYANVSVKKMLFQDLAEHCKYDGIWACASILHLPKKELKDVMYKMVEALKEDGIIYASFKYGIHEEIRNGRYFTDFTEEKFTEFIKDMKNIVLLEKWISNDARPGRGEEHWLNIILQKSNMV